MIIIISRNTVQRALILDAVRSMTNHPSAEQVYERVARICPSISRGTVYRDLNRLAENGDILRVAVANAPDRFDLTAHNHAHCICERCGRVFDYKLLVEPKLDENNNEGFTATGFDLIINGYCADCGKDING